MSEPLHEQQHDVCLNHGLLVSLHDGDLTGEERFHAEQHLAYCPDCEALERLVRQRSQEVAQTLALLDPLEQQAPSPEQAFARFQARLDRASVRNERGRIEIIRLPGKKLRSTTQRPRVRVSRKLLAAVAVILLVLFTLPNASAWARAFLTLFQVQQVQPVTIDLPHWRQAVLQDLQHFGTLQVQQSAATSAPNLTLTQAEQVTHFPLLLPTHLPVGVEQVPQVSIIEGGEARFVFQQAKTAAYLAQLGDSATAIPMQLEGATFQVTFAAGAEMSYTGKTPVVLKEVPSPVVQGTTASALTTLQQFLLAVPHLPTELHDLAQHLNQTSGTVPLPLPSQVHTQSVTVQGTTGVLLSEPGMNGGILIWQARGIIYTLGSLAPAGDVLDIASSLSAHQ